MSHRGSRVSLSEQDHTPPSRNQSRSHQTASKDHPAEVPSQDRISTVDPEEQPQEDSAGLRDPSAATRHVAFNQKTEKNHPSHLQVSTPPNVFTSSLNIPSPASHRKLSGIPQLNLPTNRVGNDTVAGTSVHSSAPRPSRMPLRNSKQSSDFQSARLRNMSTLIGVEEDVPEVRTPDGLFLYDSETEEGSIQSPRSAIQSPRSAIQSPRSAGGCLVKREPEETRRGAYETGEHVKRVEFTRPPCKNQYLTDTPSNTRRSAHTFSGNDNSVSKSGSFSIPARTTYVSQLRPDPLVLDCRRTPSPGGFGSRRPPDYSPRSLMSTNSMISLDGRPSKIPRLVRTSSRTLSASAHPPTAIPYPIPAIPYPTPAIPYPTPAIPYLTPLIPYEVRYSIYNIFTIVMTVGCEDHADRLDLLSKEAFATKSTVNEYNMCDVRICRTYKHPTVHKIMMYDPVKISTKQSDIVSAILSIEKPSISQTLSSVAKVGNAEETDKHVIHLTEFQDAVRVYQPVVPTGRPDTAQPPADSVTGSQMSKKHIISIIPPVVLANAHLKKQRRSKSVQSKAQSTVRHAVQCSVQPRVQSSLLPAVQTSLPTMVRSSVPPAAARSSVQHVIQSPARPSPYSLVLPTSRPTKKTSSLVSAIVEVSFTDLDKKAFEPQRLSRSLAEPNHKSKSKTRNTSKDGDRKAKQKSRSDSGREGLLNSASRSALKSIVRAILINSGVKLPGERPGNRKDIADGETAAAVPLRHSRAKTSSSTLATSTPPRKNRDAENRPPVTTQSKPDRSRGESFVGHHPLGSSVTQVFCKRKERHRHENDTDLTWTKALYAKTLYFKNETRENQQKQTNARNALSTGHLQPVSSTSGRQERSASNHFHSSATLPEWRSSNLSPTNSLSSEFDTTFASLEQTMSNLLLDRFDQFQPMKTRS